MRLLAEIFWDVWLTFWSFARDRDVPLPLRVVVVTVCCLIGVMLWGSIAVLLGLFFVLFGWGL